MIKLLETALAGFALACLCARAAAATATAPVSDDEWPEFRGPTAQGHATAQLPLEWSPTKNVAWKQPLPGAGWSSPVVGRGRVYLTTGIAAPGGRPALHALCLDAATGRILWDTSIFSAEETSPQRIHDKNSPASPTPILQADRVYVHFGHHGTAALTREGKILWRTNEHRYDPVHGNGGSPLLAGDRLVFNADGARDPHVYALDKHTGKLAWKSARNVPVRSTFSFCTPLLIHVDGRPQIITPGSGAVAALDPEDGREIWRARYGQGFSVVPRPVLGHDLLFVATGYHRAELLAIRAGGKGDVTETHIAWRTATGAPLTPSVLLVGDELYAVNDSGIASCFDARTGRVHWQERLDGNYSASPLFADGRIYFQNEAGLGTVLKADKVFTKLATNDLQERTLASPAVAAGALFIRTEKHLYRIERK